MGFDEAGVRRRGRAAVAALAVFACALAMPAAALAAEPEFFTVNSVADQEDAAPGTGGCETAAGECTLRAAIEEANASLNEPEQRDTIEFDELVFGAPGAAIVLADSLPEITDPLYLRGTGECLPSGVVDPCVELSGPSDDAALRVQDTADVVVERLAVTGARTGIEINGSTSVKLFKNWFGVKLDGSAGPNETGVLYGPGSDAGVVGTPGKEEEGNLFANNTAVGLDLFGASHASVVGNSFGVEPDGSTAAPNGKDIEVTSDANGGNEAVGNEIGGRVASDAVGGPCDRACNLISGAAFDGIDLEGDDGDEGPATATSIAGNYFGLDATGTAAVANGSAAIRVSSAAQTVIGGQKPGDANHFGGGPFGVLAGPAAPDLVIRGNQIGLGAEGAPLSALTVESEGLASPAVEALIEDNVMRMNGGVGITQTGFGARITGNRISFAEAGIKVSGAAGSQGNLIADNTFEQIETTAIRIQNERNEVVGNRILGTGTAGIQVRGPLPFAFSENLIGGDSAAEENEISGSAGPAIEIATEAGAMTTVARNRGSANSGPFIDLVTLGAESEGPNGAIAPPAIFAATSTGAVGTAEPGATVRVYRKRTAAPGELEAFLGAAAVDEEGNWSLAYPALAAGTAIAASQTSEAGGSSELALAAVAGEPAGPAPGGGDGGVSGDKTPPRTAILGGPKARSTSATARFRFDSDELGTSFQCRLDRKAFRPCRSPKRYRGLRPGRHVFAVRAVDAAGNVDRSPAKRTFTVVAP